MFSLRHVMGTTGSHFNSTEDGIFGTAVSFQVVRHQVLTLATNLMTVIVEEKLKDGLLAP